MEVLKIYDIKLQLKIILHQDWTFIPDLYLTLQISQGSVDNHDKIRKNKI